METSASYTTKDCMFFSSDERKWITKVRKLKQKFPDLVEIIREPEQNDGCIYAKVPVSWMKLNPPRQLSDEKRAELSARAKQIFTDS